MKSMKQLGSSVLLFSVVRQVYTFLRMKGATIGQSTGVGVERDTVVPFALEVPL